jgi:hypothetical protein
LGYTPHLKSHRVKRIVALRHEPRGMTFVFFLGEPGDEKLVAHRLKEIFAAAREADLRQP